MQVVNGTGMRAPNVGGGGGGVGLYMNTGQASAICCGISFVACTQSLSVATRACRFVRLCRMCRDDPVFGEVMAGQDDCR